jgi:hypothetical protein
MLADLWDAAVGLATWTIRIARTISMFNAGKAGEGDWAAFMLGA